MTRGTQSGTLRVGTRGSALALAQTARVIALLRARTPELKVEPVSIRTEGDIDKTSPLAVIGGRGVFTSALEEALLHGAIDAAVHSAKDLPSERPTDLALVAFPEREDARDVLVSRHGGQLAELPPRPTIGTSSRRRALQVRLRRPDAQIVELRGNVDTRLRKAFETEVDAIVLAAAGVRRMGWTDRVTEELPLAWFVPSPGQGALAVEARAADGAVFPLLAALDDPTVSRAVRVERAFLRAVGAGCTAPIGAHAEAEGDALRLRVMLGSEDGDRAEWADERLDPALAEAQAAEVAARLLARLQATRTAFVGARPGRNGRAAVRTDESTRLPLAGVSVLVTRPRAQARSLSDALREQGAEPIELPTIRIDDPADFAPLDDALQRLARGGYDWLVFTSANAVGRVLGRMERLAIDRTALSRVRVAAVGRATAAALTARGVRVDVVPEQSVAEAVVAALGDRGIAGRRVLYPKADAAREVLPAGLRAHGAEVDAVDAYRTLQETDLDPAVRNRVLSGDIQVVTFASPSSVRGLKGLLGESFAAVARADVVCVGPVTAAAAREFGLPVHVVADDPTPRGVVEALVRHRAERLASGASGDYGARPEAVMGAAAAPRGERST